MICIAFAHLTWRNGLPDIESRINTKPKELYHLGFREPVAKSTLADAKETRDWRLWENLAKNLINRDRALYQGDSLVLDLDNTIYALDISTIDLTISVLPVLFLHILVHRVIVDFTFASSGELRADEANWASAMHMAPIPRDAVA